MAIVIDAARADYIEPAPTMRYMQFFTAPAETHIPFAYEAPVNNTGDAWVPLVATGSDAAAP